MNKSDLISAFALKENLTDKNALAIVNLIFDGFTDALKKGDRIELRRFGSFTVREYGAYSERIQRPARRFRLDPRGYHFSRWGRN